MNRIQVAFFGNLWHVVCEKWLNSTCTGYSKWLNFCSAWWIPAINNCKLHHKQLVLINYVFHYTIIHKKVQLLHYWHLYWLAKCKLSAYMYCTHHHKDDAPHSVLINFHTNNIWDYGNIITWLDLTRSSCTCMTKLKTGQWIKLTCPLSDNDSAHNSTLGYVTMLHGTI